MPRTLAFAAAALLALALSPSPAQKRTPIPHGQDAPPGPALSPAEAVRKMKVPDGFSVEVVACEPDLVNPVAMTFDEAGRVWVTESVEYPRRSPGPGKDRVKVLEIGPDGKVSKVTVFAEGLNIPSGIAVGHGGVWVANAPDILFYKIGPDGKAAGKPEVVVTGFGRDDTHELPNSLTWGPDGCLYGWNGVFNPSRVRQNGKEWNFTCAIFRIHPKTRAFSLFCEGTSNPWGLAINDNGDFFASACVIDHLWHLTETGYYIRQGGPYPPFTWPIGSIVKHRHQKAAYCGIHYFDSDAYPKEYRERLYMGNIHGGCINVDTLRRDGATYFASPAPDFLTANDPWFMPVAQKTGPDGCLYILDWYDRYHCYQDANRDPKGIDRLRGRLYRVRYKGTPRAKPFDMAKESNEKLVGRLSSPNAYYRDAAQRVLTERLLGTAHGAKGANPDDVIDLIAKRYMVHGRPDRKTLMHVLWTLIGSGKASRVHMIDLAGDKDSTFRAWAVRIIGGGTGPGEESGREFLRTLLKSEKSPEVLVQLAIANKKLDLGGIPFYLALLRKAPTDRLLQHIVWQNMHPLLETKADVFVEAAKKGGKLDYLGEILPRAADRIVASKKPQVQALAGLYTLARDGKSPAARQILTALTGRLRSGEIGPTAAGELKRRFAAPLAAEQNDPDAVSLLCALGDSRGIAQMRRWLGEADGSAALRLRALEALAFAKDPAVLGAAEKMLGDAHASGQVRAAVLAALGRLEDDRVAAAVLRAYPALPPDLRPRAVDLLTQRDSWGKALLGAIAAKKVPAGALNVNQARRLLSSRDAELVASVKRHWGTLRDARNPEREKVVTEMKEMLRRSKGDPKRGAAVYKTLCGQCHRIHGEGVEVGPDLTGNGRASFDQLLSNVFDPSLVIGPGYHAVTVETTRGRSLTGLLVEDGAQRVVLKLQGGKQEAVARRNVERVEVSKLSMMPEGIEKQLKPQEIVDLFAFLAYDRHPDDPKARPLPGTPAGLLPRR